MWKGYDLEVIRGAERTIRRDCPLLFCEAHPSPKTTALMTLLKEWEYEHYWFFAPFVSARQVGEGKGPTKIVGDANIAAFPFGKEPLWELPRIRNSQEDWRTRAKEFSYLGRYGYNL